MTMGKNSQIILQCTYGTLFPSFKSEPVTEHFVLDCPARCGAEGRGKIG
jgi:hypothetical protein